jgi:hypothetical protein
MRYAFAHGQPGGVCAVDGVTRGVAVGVERVIDVGVE